MCKLYLNLFGNPAVREMVSS